MSRKPCAGSKVKETSRCCPVSLNLRAGCRHIGGCLRDQHYMFILLLYSSQAHLQQTSSLHGPLVELGVASHAPRRGCQPREGLLGSPLVLHAPAFCSPSPCRSLCSLYAWVSFERISALGRDGMQAHVLLAWCQDTERDSPGPGL